MADNIAISLKNISKIFKRYKRPADRLKEILLPGKTYAQEFWALRDISLEIPRGETWGIVGRNGAGKSTLLKIITGTLQPTSGLVQVNGRISALLELGSGFNPEFTGRQNIFFNGRLLGLSQLDIEERFDSIVTFADIGDFLDQPVKTYSSGMRARLAFAVASSVEPDVFIVDEVLAVGDAAFKRKCFARMGSIRERGCTILFVSHSVGNVIELCDHGILIDAGENLLVADAKTVTTQYHKLIYAPPIKIPSIKQEIKAGSISATNNEVKKISDKDAIPSAKTTFQTADKKTDLSREYFDPNLKPKSTVSYISNGAKISNFRILNRAGRKVNVLLPMQEYQYCYDVLMTQPSHQIRCGMLIKTVKGLELGGMVTHPVGDGLKFAEANSSLSVRFKFRACLGAGNYFLNAGVLGQKDEMETYLARIIDTLIFRIMPDKGMTTTSHVAFSVGFVGEVAVTELPHLV